MLHLIRNSTINNTRYTLHRSLASLSLSPVSTKLLKELLIPPQFCLSVQLVVWSVLVVLTGGTGGSSKTVRHEAGLCLLQSMWPPGLDWGAKLVLIIRQSVPNISDKPILVISSSSSPAIQSSHWGAGRLFVTWRMGKVLGCQRIDWLWWLVVYTVHSTVQPTVTN